VLRIKGLKLTSGLQKAKTPAEDAGAIRKAAVLYRKKETARVITCQDKKEGLSYLFWNVP
jgi:hypothetical protein